MATKRQKQNQEGWRGDAVEPARAGAAEAEADRAAGRTPERVSPAPETIEQQPEEGVRRAASQETPEEKIDEAAEEHRERIDSEGRPARGHL